MCDVLAGLPALPAKHLYKSPIKLLSLSVRVCLSFVLLSLQLARFFYSFEFSGSCVLTHYPTLTLDTHTPCLTQYSLCLA